MFDWPGRPLAIAYRLLMIMLVLIVNNDLARMYKKIVTKLPNHIKSSLDLYWICVVSFVVFAIIRVTLLEIQHHNTLTLILSKRIDTRYFKRITAREHRTGEEGPGHKSVSDRFLATGDNCMPNVSFLRSVLLIEYTGNSVMILIGEMLSRFLPDTNLRPTTMGHTKSDDELPGSIIMSMGSLPGDTSNSSLFARMAATNQTSLEMTTTNRLQLVAGHVISLVCTFVATFILDAAGNCQSRAQELLTLAITVSMADALRRINEQNAANYKMQPARIKLDSFSQTAVGYKNKPPLKLVPSTDLLVQVRDVLVVLGQVSNLTFVIHYLHELAWTLGIVFFALALLTVRASWWALYCACASVWIVLKLFAHRLIYRKLHNEANEIRETCQWHLANASYLTDSHRMETLTNLKLAEEITQTWPTNWIKYDIKSLISAALKAFCFVVALHKVAEVDFRVHGQAGSAQRESSRSL